MWRFSSRLVRSTRSTWSVELLPTSVTTGVLASTRARQFPSSAVPARVPGHAERRDLRLAQRDARDAPEELRVLGIRAGPAALDVADPERVQPAGDPDLVLRREGEAFALRAVSQGRVVQDRVHVALRVFHSLSKKSGPSRERPRCLGATLCSSAERR